MPNFFYLIVISVLLLGSCRSTRKIQTAIAKKDSVAVEVIQPEVPKEDTSLLIKKYYGGLMNNRVVFTTFAAKIDVDYEDNSGKKYNVNAHVRMYKDSVIWLSVTAILGIEGLRAYITRDSVKILDKQNKTYMARSVSYLQEVTALPLDLSSMQDLIVGNPVFVSSDVVSLTRNDDLISMFIQGVVFKNLVTIQENDQLLKSSKLDDIVAEKSRTSYLNFWEYENKAGFPFSTKRSIIVTEKKKLEIRLSFKNYSFNETLTFPFSVPKNYNQE